MVGVTSICTRLPGTTAGDTPAACPLCFVPPAVLLFYAQHHVLTYRAIGQSAAPLHVNAVSEGVLCTAQRLALFSHGQGISRVTCTDYGERRGDSALNIEYTERGIAGKLQASGRLQYSTLVRFAGGYYHLPQYIRYSCIQTTS